MDEVALASGPMCGAALFVALAGRNLPRRRIAARPRALTFRWLGLVAMASLEELVWRGLVLAGLALAVGPLGGLLVSAAGFAAWHAPGLGRRCIVHLFTGLGFGSAFLLGGLPAAVLAHGTYNLLVDWAVQAERSNG